MSSAAETAVMIPCEGESLVGILHVPQGTAAEHGVVIVVGGPQYRAGSHRQFVATARALSEAGYAVLRFDCRGMGDSGAPMRDFEHVDADIRAAVDALLSHVVGLDGVVLYGLCDGAAAALMYSATDPRVSGLILLNPWVRTEATEAATHLRYYYVQRLLQPAFWRKVLGAKFNPIRAGAGFARNLRRSLGSGGASRSSSTYVERMLSALTAFRGRALFLISGQDLTAKEFVQLCRNEPRWRGAVASPPISRVELPDADHTFSTRDHLNAANQSCVEWLKRELNRPAMAGGIGEERTLAGSPSEASRWRRVSSPERFSR